MEMASWFGPEVISFKLNENKTGVVILVISLIITLTVLWAHYLPIVRKKTSMVPSNYVGR